VDDVPPGGARAEGLEVPTINVKTWMAGPQEPGAKGPGAPIINVKTSTAGLREVPELEVRERKPSPWKHRRQAPGGAGAEGPGAPTINVKS
jgi:hypothetical protein